MKEVRRIRETPAQAGKKIFREAATSCPNSDVGQAAYMLLHSRSTPFSHPEIVSSLLADQEILAELTREANNAHRRSPRAPERVTSDNMRDIIEGNGEYADAMESLTDQELAQIVEKPFPLRKDEEIDLNLYVGNLISKKNGQQQ